MSKIDRFKQFERNPFLSTDEPTLADLVGFIEACDHLSPTRKRDLRSAIHRFCALTHRDPAMVAASVAELKAGLATINFARAGLSRKTYGNMRSYLLAALRESGLRIAPNTTKTKLSPAWRALFETLPTKRLQNGLSRFIRFCSAMGVGPNEVEDRITDAFADALVHGTFVRNPHRRFRDTCRLWNMAAEAIPGWPQLRLTVPSFKRPAMTLPLDAYRSSFGEDVEAHLHWMAGKDPFASHPPPRPAKPGTIELRRKHILGAAAALVRRGGPVEEICSLKNLVAPNAVKEILCEHMERKGGEPTQYTRNLCKALIQIARHWLRVSPEQVAQLKEIKRRLGSDRSGLTEKNRTVLRQFDDEQNTELLICLPQDLADLVARSGRRDVRTAIKMQTAVAIEILLMTGMRIGNLIALRLDRHVLRPGGKDGRIFLVLPGSECKNGEPMDYPLPAESVALLDRYITDFRSLLAGPDSPWLFPSRGGNRKSSWTLRGQIKKTVRRQTGIEIAPHQFRHFAAKQFLDADPGNYEGTRQFLGHKSMKTTTSFYAGLQTRRAAAHYDELLSQKRRRLRKKPPRGRS